MFHPDRQPSDTAVAFRRHPTTTDAPDSMRSVVIVEPFGDGRTSLGTAGPASSLDGDNESAVGEPGAAASSRPTASTASRSRANASASAPFHRYGKTLIPRSTATHTDVEKLNTSTRTFTSAPTAHLEAPVEAHGVPTLEEQVCLVRRTQATRNGVIAATLSRSARRSRRSS